LQTTIVLWGVTKIGTRFHQFIDYNIQMKKLLQDNENQLLLIHDQNRALTEYSKQVEQLTIVEERNRISQELHDTVGHTLTSMIAGLELAKREESPSIEGARQQPERLDMLLDIARRGLEEIRDHVHHADHFGLHESLVERIDQMGRELSVNTGIQIQCHTEGTVYALSHAHHLALLRCAQEALTNAVRHGQPDRVTIRFHYAADKVRLEIRDNGSGAARDKLQQGFGIRTMKERVSAVHGTVELTSEIGGGVQVVCEIPMKRRNHKQVIRLLLAEDQELIAESFRILLEMEPDLEVLGVASNGRTLLQMCELDRPDVILMDIHMPEMNGIQATTAIKQCWPDIKIIVLTTFPDTEYASEAISLGAEGFLLKSIKPLHLAEAIRIVNSGGSLISMETAKLLADTDHRSPALRSSTKEERMEGSNPLYGLNEKEMEIIRYLSDGLKYKEIAQRMHFSESTIKNYVSIIYSKLNVDNRTQAVNKVQGLL
jgi:DNA-binding NarL/FixJ family response regulator/two-component sensor histidine kinase